MITVENNLVAFYLGMYNTGKITLGFLFTIGVSKEVFLATYKMLLKDGSLQPIEKLPEDEKKELVSECKTAELNFTNSTLIDAAKILHTIKFINANS